MKKEIKKVAKKEVKKEEKNGKAVKVAKVVRSAEEIKAVDTKLNRVVGLVGGIKKMLEDGRSSDEVLMQLSAMTSILTNVKLLILKEMMEKEVEQKLQKNDVIDYDKLLFDVKKYL